MVDERKEEATDWEVRAIRIIIEDFWLSLKKWRALVYNYWNNSPKRGILKVLFLYFCRGNDTITLDPFLFPLGHGSQEVFVGIYFLKVIKFGRIDLANKFLLSNLNDEDISKKGSTFGMNSSQTRNIFMCWAWNQIELIWASFLAKSETALFAIPLIIITHDLNSTIIDFDKTFLLLQLKRKERLQGLSEVRAKIF